MQIVRYQSGSAAPCVGVREGSTVRPLEGAPTMGALLGQSLDEAKELVSRVDADAPLLDVSGLRLLAPVDGRAEVWCAGVTYERSRGARMEESSEQSVYDRVYTASRPELFPKAPAWRVVTDGEPVGIRVDSGHDVPEPELGVVVNADGEIFGFTVCDDVSSRAIEGANPLYIPQAKVFAGACALAAGIRPVWEVADPTDLVIETEVRRSGELVFAGRTTTGQMHRTLAELVDHLCRANDFPDGVVLATGTGIVPELDFALAGGDTIRIEIEEVGLLVNTVAVGREPFAWLRDRAVGA